MGDAVELNSTDVTTLSKGAEVRVVEVVHRAGLMRVRGRIDQPVAGWISLENMDNGFRWVRTGLVWHAQHMQHAIWCHQ